MTAKSKLYTIFFTFICLFLSSMMLIIFFSLKTKTKHDNGFLKVKDLQVEVGQFAQLNISMPENTNVIECQTINQSIAVVQDNLVFGVSKGVTYVKVEVKFKEKNMSQFAQIVVNGTESELPSDEGFEYNIVPVKNCEYTDGTLYYGASATFYVDYLGEKWKDNTFVVEVVSDLSFSREFRNYIIKDNKNGYMYFTYDEEKFTIALNCIFKNS